MRKPILLCCCLGAMAYVTGAEAARAGNLISFVSNSGSDTNDCASQATACANFNIALSKTNNYGEIDCVNAGDYSGAFPISQSVTIDCAGGVGSIVGPIQISQGDIVVRLRNLSFNGAGLGGYAIDAQTLAALYIENCVITNHNAANQADTPYVGIKFEPTTNAQLFVTNSIISDNGYAPGGITGGIYVVPASGVTARISIDHSQMTGNTFGIAADGSAGGIIQGVIKDSVVSGNSENGITAHTAGSIVHLVVDESSVSGNDFGLVAGGSGAAILARNTTVFNNATGLFTNNSGSLITYGNNSVAGNTTNGAFTATAAMQ